MRASTKRPSVPATVYPPLEDSLLLADVVRTHAHGAVLDMGCGNGIQARMALTAKKVTSVLCVDINPAAILHCKNTIADKRARCLLSDLFAKVPKKKFDTIIFNPPYLPQDDFPFDPATIGGEKGWETVARFLAQAPAFLAPKGQILLLFTSLTNKQKIHELMDHALLDWTSLATNHIAFETYYVYRLVEQQSRIDAEKRGVDDITYFSRGKRGWIFTGTLKGWMVALKIKNPVSLAMGRVENEAAMLRLVNKKGIGPAVRFSTENVLCYDFVKGVLIKDWLAGAKRPAVLRVLRAVLGQCRTLDEMGIQKEEMHHPHKHIVIGKKIVLLDFERAHKTLRPHNVTQYCQYISSLSLVLQEKGITISRDAVREAATAYAANDSDAAFKRIRGLLR